ncbi:MAG: AbrB/MazE/SpoVT family DNA-binding domain-containing protein [Lachnospiraceae bacterium]|nr:AbrB/MazE/SpoVT family DNA-binding domain-containing protein [Lachnospiraceae bacterium]
MQTTIQKWRNSQMIRISKAFLETACMAENNSVELERMNDSIIIKKVEHFSKVTLEGIFAGYEGDYKTENFDWGKPVGKEEW